MGIYLSSSALETNILLGLETSDSLLVKMISHINLIKWVLAENLSETSTSIQTQIIHFELLTKIGHKVFLKLGYFR